MSSQERFFHAGQILFKEGEDSRSMYLVVQGTVSIRKMRGTHFIEIAKVHSNEVIGELAFFDRQPRSATATAISDVKVLEIDFDALDKVYSEVPDYLKSIISATADRLRRANETIRRLQKGGGEMEGYTPGESSGDGGGDGTGTGNTTARGTDLENALAATAGIGVSKPKKPE